MVIGLVMRQGEDAVDTQAFPDRRRALKPGQQDVWAEAQRMFQDKLAEKIAGGEIAPAPACSHNAAASVAS